MQTFISERPLAQVPDFQARKKAALKRLTGAEIDAPIRDAVRLLNSLPWCFTLQCCAGHFVPPGEGNQHTLERVDKDSLAASYTYRIAYLALCLDDTPKGRDFLARLRRIPGAVDPKYVQFGCAQWFLDQHADSYVLQVQPAANALVDHMDVDADEALRIQSARDIFWRLLEDLARGLAQ